MLKNENTTFDIASEADFERHALELFHFQYEYNQVYKLWVDLLKISPRLVSTVGQIPFLPIEFFKNFNQIYKQCHHGQAAVYPLCEQRPNIRGQFFEMLQAFLR
jgi:hypothetical protein